MATFEQVSKTNAHAPSKSTTNQFKQGDIVLLTQARVGVVRYVGAVEGKSQSIHDHYIGIEIRITDGVIGDNDGTFNNKTYFKCANNCGLFLEPQHIIQLYAPEDLLEMIINLKDKLLPLMDAVKSAQTNTHSKHRPNTSNATSSGNNSSSLQYIKEDEDRDSFTISPNAPTKFNIQVESPHLKFINQNMGSPEFQLKPHNISIHQLKKSSHSQFDDVDMKIAAPNNLLSYFEHADDNVGQPLSPFYKGQSSPYMSPSPSPTSNIKKHRTGLSRLSLFKVHSIQHTTSMNRSYGSLMSSYAKLKLVHRCVTLRHKTNSSSKTKPSIVLDLAHFGMYLKHENMNDKHPWFDSIWNKYDKLFKLKIEFYFVNELLSDLLNEYLVTEYEIKSDEIMFVDIKKAVQQIIIQIRPYHIEQHNTEQNPFDMNVMNEDELEDEMPFTFADWCLLGEWLGDIEEMEEDDEFQSDYFMMDMHYFDFVQYVNSHKGHVWKTVVHKAIKSKKKKKDLSKLNMNKIGKVMEAMLMDYGKNGLGNMNMEIYHNQIREYSTHLTRLFSEYKSTQLQTVQKNSIHKMQFFEFIACIPSL
eukprot:43479_1